MKGIFSATAATTAAREATLRAATATAVSERAPWTDPSDRRWTWAERLVGLAALVAAAEEWQETGEQRAACLFGC